MTNQVNCICGTYEASNLQLKEGADGNYYQCKQGIDNIAGVIRNTAHINKKRLILTLIM